MALTWRRVTHRTEGCCMGIGAEEVPYRCDILREGPGGAGNMVVSYTIP